MSAAYGSGLVSNPSDSRQVDVVVCAMVTWMIALGFVILRFYTRRCIIHKVGAEDWVILLALFFSALNTAGFIEQAVHGLGRHLLDVNPASMLPLVRAAWYTILWYQLTLLCVKISIILLYLRILTYHHARYAVYSILVLVVLTNLYAFVIMAASCIPLQAYWDTSIEGAYCLPRSYFWVNTALHMATDFLIFALPMPIIFTMNTPIRQKIALYGIFAFGFFVCFVSVIRLLALLKIDSTPDGTHDNDGVWYWSCVELNTAITCACIITLKPLMVRLFPKWHTSPTGPAETPASSDPRRGPLTIGSRPSRFITPDDRPRRQSWHEPPWTAQSATPIYERHMALKQGYFAAQPPSWRDRSESTPSEMLSLGSQRSIWADEPENGGAALK